jgi:hypothetical protein
VVLPAAPQPIDRPTLSLERRCPRQPTTKFACCSPALCQNYLAALHCPTEHCLLMHLQCTCHLPLPTLFPCVPRPWPRTIVVPYSHAPSITSTLLEQSLSYCDDWECESGGVTSISGRDLVVPISIPQSSKHIARMMPWVHVCIGIQPNALLMHANPNC